jgi:hypothetical protein
MVLTGRCSCLCVPHFLFHLACTQTGGYAGNRE